MNSMFGVFASFQTTNFDATEKGEDKDVEAFKEYLWGKDRNGGLGGRLSTLKPNYGDSVKLILLQFNVKPVEGWPQPKVLENYRPKEKSVGVWIEVNNDNFFRKDDIDRDRYVQSQIVDRLEQLKKRFEARKLDVDMDKLIEDTRRVLNLRD